MLQNNIIFAKMVTKILKQSPHSFNELYMKLKHEFTETALNIELRTLMDIGAIKFENDKYYK